MVNFIYQLNRAMGRWQSKYFWGVFVGVFLKEMRGSPSSVWAGTIQPTEGLNRTKEGKEG